MCNSDQDKAVHAVCVDELHKGHPSIRASDWRSPLVARLTGEQPYTNGHKDMNISYRPDEENQTESSMRLSWTGLDEDYELCLNTYQQPVITEFAALGVACILCECVAHLEITEVTRRGEKVDYWLGDREMLLEVSGMQSGNLETLCDQKSTGQLQINPFCKDGYVCVCRFDEPEARLWFFAYPGSKPS